MNKFVVDENFVGERLDCFVLKHLVDRTRSSIKNQIENGEILLNNKVVKSGEKLKLGDEITAKDIINKELSVKPENIELDIIYQDNDLAVINKPKGMVVHPANGNAEGTLVNALLYHLDNLSGINGVIRPGIIHRLDKDTSGLLIVAKNDKSHVNLSKQIETKSCHRYYLAICCGNIKEDSGQIKTGYGRSLKDRKQMSTFPIGTGKDAITNYKVLERFGNYTLVEFMLQTGRTHQIRVHSKHINHPIACDEVYGHRDKYFKANGQLLHAYKIEFTQPTTNQKLCFTCSLPTDFESALNKLRNQNQSL